MKQFPIFDDFAMDASSFLLRFSCRAKVYTNFDSGVSSILPVNIFILDVYMVSLLLNSSFHVSCLFTILMAPQCLIFCLQPVPVIH